MNPISDADSQRTSPAANRVQALYEEQYQLHAEREGDEHPKRDAASARRMATAAVGAARQFDRLLPADDLEALRRAASILRTLASDLDVVAAISKAAKKDREQRELEARQEKADLAASARWASEEAMRTEATDLAVFADPANFQSHVWVLDRHPGYKSVGLPLEIQRGRRLIDLLKPRSVCGDAFSLKRRAAEYVLALENAQRIREAHAHHKDNLQIGLDDFEAWREWRRQVRSVVPPA